MPGGRLFAWTATNSKIEARSSGASATNRRSRSEHPLSKLSVESGITIGQRLSTAPGAAVATARDAAMATGRETGTS